MNKFFKNQMNIFITLVSILVVISIVWFFAIYNGLSATNENLSSEVSSEQSKSNRASDLMDKLDGVKSEWSELNSDFEAQISRIPDISQRKRINNVIFGIIKKSEIPVTVWQPSEFAIDEKIIFIPDTGDEIKISKYPMDIEVICTFQDFGVLMEKFRAHEDRLAISNLNIIEKGWTERQTVSFVLYTYFQTSMNLKATG
ncbi:MAG: hypothetical protein ACJZ12_00040 [Candidatus Neomarinimicrobiota bacterium]